MNGFNDRVVEVILQILEVEVNAKLILHPRINKSEKKPTKQNHPLHIPAPRYTPLPHTLIPIMFS